MRVVVCFMGLALAYFWVASQSYAATLLIKDNTLVKITGLQAGDKFYDVEFVDGSCVELFDGCDEESDFLSLPNDQLENLTTALSDQISSFLEWCVDFGINGVDTGGNITFIMPQGPSDDPAQVNAQTATYSSATAIWSYIVGTHYSNTSSTNADGSIVYIITSENGDIDMPAVPLPPALLLFFGAGMVLLRFVKVKARNA
ncbi:hypothetical protein [Sneathiella limimaris]|uniref:hypothetical protein n=1 Tax=Sneathiella limimaris TaxID=1964213 RepID=UPI00146D8175|nr:hypothetical protein [Sneathiella limimaris]